MAIAADHIGALLKLPLLRAALIAGACWYVLDVREIMDYKQAFKEREARIHNAIIYRHLHNNLPPDVHIVATDYFEFVNLMPGDYLIFAEIGYVHTSRRTEVVGYTDTYVNGLYQGTSENTTVRSYVGNTSATVKKVVKIEKEGETVEVKLKKTL